MTKEKLIQNGYKLNDTYTSFKEDKKERVKDYEILQVEAHSYCSYWKLVPFSEYHENVKIVKLEGMETIFETTDFDKIPKELLDLKVITTCTSYQGFTLYV